MHTLEIRRKDVNLDSYRTWPFNLQQEKWLKSIEKCIFCNLDPETAARILFNCLELTYKIYVYLGEIIPILPISGHISIHEAIGYFKSPNL